MLILGHHQEGLSFSQLAKIFTRNHNTLNRHLKTLTHATLVWNFYERRKGKDHSFYKLSALGERVLGSLRPELEAAQQEPPIHRHSSTPVSA
jgi:DNA-binding IclR family transcriptional regulator